MSTVGFVVLLLFMWWLFGPVGVLLVFVAALIIALINAAASGLSALWPRSKSPSAGSDDDE
jgi:hypothetical protein